MDRRRCITPEKNCAWSFAGTVDSISLAQDEAAGTLTVTVSAADEATWTLTFSEEGFSAQNAPEQTLEFGSGNDPVAVSWNSAMKGFPMQSESRRAAFRQHAPP